MHNFRIFKWLFIAPIVAVLPVQGAVLIDQFNSTATGGARILEVRSLPLPATANTATYTGVGIPGVLGGERRFTIVRTAATGTGQRRITASISDVAPHFLEYESTTGAEGYVELTYGVNSDLNFDMSAEAWFEIDVESYDLPGGNPLVASLFLRSSAGSGTATRSLTTESGILTFEFNDANYGAVDFADIDSITARFTVPRGGDFSVNSITAVPEPSASMMALAGSALMMFRRRVLR